MIKNTEFIYNTANGIIMLIYWVFHKMLFFYIIITKLFNEESEIALLIYFMNAIIL